MYSKLLMIHLKPTISRTSIPLPPTDFRLDNAVRGDRERSWLILNQTHRSALQYYYLVVTRLLSRLKGTSIVALRESLIFDYYCDSETIDKVVDLLLISKDVEVESATVHVNLSVLYRKPRLKVSLFGPYSIWIPHRC